MNKGLVELETRLAYYERVIDDLNDVVVKQQRQIDKLSNRINFIISILKSNKIVLDLDSGI